MERKMNVDEWIKKLEEACEKFGYQSQFLETKKMFYNDST